MFSPSEIATSTVVAPNFLNLSAYSSASSSLRNSTKNRLKEVYKKIYVSRQEEDAEARKALYADCADHLPFAVHWNTCQNICLILTWLVLHTDNNKNNGSRDRETLNDGEDEKKHFSPSIAAH